jgi:hypothetical protein
MIIGVMSDSHGNRRLMHQVADYMELTHGVELIFHVGDDYADAQELVDAGHRVKMVPGLWCDEYHDRRVPNRIVESCDGITIAAAHAEKDLHAPERAASIVLTGHTHEARIEQIGRTVYLNPGHLKAPEDRGQAASYAIIETSADGIRVAIHEVAGGMREERRFARGELA